MAPRWHRSLVAGGVLATLLLTAAVPAVAGAPCATAPACCPCGEALLPEVPTVDASCCCEVRAPEAPLPPAPTAAPGAPAPIDLAAPAAALPAEPRLAVPTATPPEARPTGPDPPPIWLLTTSVRR